MIRDEWRTWLEDGPAVMLAGVNADGTAEICRVVGLRVDSPTSVRLLFAEANVQQQLTNLAQGRSQVAASATRISDFRCLQFKGRGEAVPVDDDDRRENARYRERFLAICRQVFAGVPQQGFERARTVPEVCIRLAVREIYDQSPGPLAGLVVAPKP